MKDKTYYCHYNIIEDIYTTSLILISNKHFDKSLYLISNILKIIYKAKKFEIFEKLTTDQNNILMLNLILEKDYSNNTENIIYMSDTIN